jgi:hypothetical protein
LVLVVLVLAGLLRLQMEVILYFPLSLPQVAVVVAVVVTELNKPKMVDQVVVAVVLLQLLVLLEILQTLLHHKEMMVGTLLAQAQMMVVVVEVVLVGLVATHQELTAAQVVLAHPLALQDLL